MAIIGFLVCLLGLIYLSIIVIAAAYWNATGSTNNSTSQTLGIVGLVVAVLYLWYLLLGQVSISIN